MKKSSLLCTAVVILCMVATACSSQGSSPAGSTSKDDAVTESAVTESADQGTTQNKAAADPAGEADTAENSASEDNASEVKSGEGSFRTLSRGFYENSRGWTVRFEPSLLRSGQWLRLKLFLTIGRLAEKCAAAGGRGRGHLL